MRIRNLIVAVSAAAILAGSSMAASAGGYSFHKPDVGHATSSSGVLSVGVVIPGNSSNLYSATPISGTLQGEHTSSYATGHQGSAAERRDQLAPPAPAT